VINKFQIRDAIAETSYEMDSFSASSGHTPHSDVIFLHRLVDHGQIVFDSHNALLRRPEVGGLDRLGHDQGRLFL
jgi:hypothetical protein